MINILYNGEVYSQVENSDKENCIHIKTFKREGEVYKRDNVCMIDCLTHSIRVYKGTGMQEVKDGAIYKGDTLIIQYKGKFTGINYSYLKNEYSYTEDRGMEKGETCEDIIGTEMFNMKSKTSRKSRRYDAGVDHYREFGRHYHVIRIEDPIDLLKESYLKNAILNYPELTNYKLKDYIKHYNNITSGNDEFNENNIIKSIDWELRRNNYNLDKDYLRNFKEVMSKFIV